jgi:plastocyanin
VKPDSLSDASRRGEALWACHNAHMRRRLGPGIVLAAITAALVGAVPASADDPVLGAASYPDMTTYTCRTDALPIQPGQNLNLFGATKTCPNAQVVSGPGDTSPFAPGSTAQGFITRFKPSMVEVKPDGSLVTPSVWDLHLHHVVWLSPTGGPTFAAGEEKTNPKLPQGYGFKSGGDATWGLNYMIHNLTPIGGRQVYITWEIDWVPQTTPARTDIKAATIHWLDVAGLPHIYPVFDAERGFDTNGDGLYTFPDDVPTDPSVAGYEERQNISDGRQWTLNHDETLVFGAGHLHPGGLHVDLQVARDGPDPGTVDGDDPSEIRPLFRSDAHYYEPAGAVSWDVSMTATRPDWRVSLKSGDTVSISATYDVSKASWYESMGILPLAYTQASDPAAKDPFDDAAAVKAMYDEGGILTHGRLPENIDYKANKDLKLPDPRKLKSKGRRVPATGVEISGFGYAPGGYSASRDASTNLMRPPVVNPGQSVTFTNLDALSWMAQTDQTWHSVTSCAAPCNRGAGIGYPLATGPIKFDSGQLGYGTGTSAEVTTGSEVYTTPPLTQPGKTYTYFCRIHPFMRGSIRVRAKPKKHRGGSTKTIATL